MGCTRSSTPRPTSSARRRRSSACARSRAAPTSRRSTTTTSRRSTTARATTSRAGKDSTTWKITDADGATLVDSEEFSSIYAGETSTNYYCFPEQKCLYYLIKDGAGNGLTADGHYEVKYGKVGDLHVVAAGNE